jgi:hypothetical protein
MQVLTFVQLVGTLQVQPIRGQPRRLPAQIWGEIVITFVSVLARNILLLFEHVRKFRCCARIGA